MTDSKGHILGGLLAYIVFIVILKNLGIFLSKEKIVIYMILCLISSLIPDIDMKRSKIHRYVTFLLVSIFVVLAIYTNSPSEFYLFLFILFLALLILGKSKHRRFFHSILFAILFSLSIGIVFWSFNGDFLFPAIVSFIGIFSHLVLDKMI